MKRKHLISDAVAALLAYYPEAEIEAGYAHLQAALRKVSVRYPETLPVVNWGKVGEHVGSSTVEAALDSLIMTEYLDYCPHPPLLRLNRDKLAEAPGVELVPAGPAKEAAVYFLEALRETADDMESRLVRQ